MTNLTDMYRLFTEVKVSMGFIILSNCEVNKCHINRTEVNNRLVTCKINAQVKAKFIYKMLCIAKVVLI